MRIKRERLVEGGRMKPILFNTEMARAILAGRKTQTRRVIRPQPNLITTGLTPMGSNWLAWYDDGACSDLWPEYKSGDVLYVREIWQDLSNDEGEYAYLADGNKGLADKDWGVITTEDIKWKPSIHMPKTAARIFLKVTDVRAERLQDITAEQQENGLGILDIDSPCNTCSDNNMSYCGGGICLLEELFIELWNSTIKKQELGQYGWETNPWVWVIEFKKMEVE